MPVQRSVRFHDGFARTGNLQIHYADLADAERPLILLHGIGMDWRVWQGISRRLRPHFHLYMPDLRGHGKSDKPIDGYSIADYAADVEDFIDGLRLERVVLAGSSLGGLVAVAVEAPKDVVSHRILVDPPLTGGPVRDCEGFREILRLKHLDIPILADYLYGNNPAIGRSFARDMSEMWHEAADGVITEMLAHCNDYFDVDRALRADESPTLLMLADPTLNPALSDDDAARSLRQLPHGEAVVVEGAAHAIHASMPAKFAELLIDFVDRT